MKNNMSYQKKLILEKHVKKLDTIYLKKEAEQEFLAQKIDKLKKELTKIEHNERNESSTVPINMNKYIKSMNG